MSVFLLIIYNEKNEYFFSYKLVWREYLLAKRNLMTTSFRVISCVYHIRTIHIIPIWNTGLLVTLFFNRLVKKTILISIAFSLRLSY